MRSNHSFVLTLAFVVCCGPFLASAAMPDAASSDGAASATHVASSQPGTMTAGDDDSLDMAGFSSTYVTCRKSTSDQVLAADACMTSELKYQDARLNKTYKALLGTLDPDAKKALVEAERAWLQSQSRDQDLESTLFGDTQVGNAQQQENRLHRLCARANVLDKYLAFAQL